jgi:hypothetical protein
MRKTGLLALLVVLTCGGAMAEELQRGQKELAMNVSWFDTSDTGSTIIADVALGYMLGPSHEVGPVVTYQAFDSSEQELPEGFDDAFRDLLDNDAGTLGGFYRYNFSQGAGAFVPYLGGQASFPFGDLHDVVDYTAGVEAGVRVMPGPKASVNIEAFYNKLFAADNLDDFDQWGLAAGISIFFGGGGS